MSDSAALPNLYDLVSLFYDDPAELGAFTPIDAACLPPAPRKLLAHDHHMTVTVEAFHGCPVSVEVLAAQTIDDLYSRKILLRRSSDQVAVQFGIVRMNFAYVTLDVREAIESRKIPLGRVLIEHNVMREVRLSSLWAIAPGSELRELLGVDSHRTVFGRTALIYCEGEPAVELLEIVPEE